MAMRYRSIHKVGKGKYITSSYKISTILWVNILYWIFIFPFVFLIKYCMILPTKLIINKIQENKQREQ